MPIKPSEVNLAILEKLWEQSQQVQDACNGTGVASGMHNAMCKLMRLYNCTEEVNRHPITKMWLLKMMDLAGIIGPLMEYADTIDEWDRLVHDMRVAVMNQELAQIENEDAL